MATVKVVRVQDIPSWQTEAAFRQLLEDAAGPDIKIIRVDIAPSCTVHDGSQIAIVKFSPRLPEFLDKMAADHVGVDNHHIALPRGENDTIYTFDKAFFGLTQMYCTLKNQEILADIVAVTGLNGRAFDSWRGQDPLGQMWLQDFFREDLPSVRTMVYGYNTKWNSPGVATIDYFRAELSQEIQKARRRIDRADRPIIFIAHSFGAILVARLLMDWKYNDSPFAKAGFGATKALFLFGAPHRGMNVDDIAEMVVNINAEHRMALLNSLSLANAETLEAEAEKFVQLSNSFKIHTFLETRLSQKLTKAEDRDRGYARQGEHFDYVPRKSTVLGLPHFLELTIPVDADHSNLVKFSHRSDRTYQTTLQLIQEFLPNSTPTTLGSDEANRGTRVKLLQPSEISHKRDITERGIVNPPPSRNTVPLLSTNNQPDEASGLVVLDARRAGQFKTNILPSPLDQDSFDSSASSHGLPRHIAASYDESTLRLYLEQCNEHELFASDVEGKTLLHYAAKRGYLENIRILLDHVRNPLAYILRRDDDGNNALDVAIKYRHGDAVKFLQQRRHALADEETAHN